MGFWTGGQAVGKHGRESVLLYTNGWEMELEAIGNGIITVRVNGADLPALGDV